MCCHLRFFSNLQASNYQSDDVSLLVKNRQFFKCNNKKQHIALTTTATSQKTHYHPQTTMTTTSSMYCCVRSQKNVYFQVWQQETMYHAHHHSYLSKSPLPLSNDNDNNSVNVSLRSLSKKPRFFKCNNKKQHMVLTTNSYLSKNPLPPQTTTTMTWSTSLLVPSLKKWIFRQW